MAWIELEGAVNVRDVGGMPTTDGGSTAYGRLLRSENLQELSPNDIEKLVDKLGVTTVIDLRAASERDSEGPAPLQAVDAVRHVHHPVLPEYVTGSTKGKTEAAVALLLERVEEDRLRFPEDSLCGHYLGYLEKRPEEVTGALRAITTSKGAAIVHCAAGKDRTGVIVALALTAAGAEPEAIVADYAATADRIEAIVERLRRSRTYATDLKGRPVTAHTPKAETMLAFLEQIDVRYGGLPRWLTVSGFAEDEQAALRARLRQE
jgi:protein tyrosine/serine phosphatase